MLPARITLLHLAVSSAMSVPKSEEEPPRGVAPRSARRAFSFGSARAALIALLSLRTISAGVLFGADAVPSARLVAGHELGDGRNLRQGFRACSRRHRQGAEFSRLDVLDRRRQGFEQDLDLPIEEIRNGLRGAFVRYVEEIRSEEHTSELQSPYVISY